MIENSRVVERVMRMGIEHHSGIPTEALWDLAIKQLSEEDKRVKNAKSNFGSIEEWLNEMKKASTFAYALVESASGLAFMRISEIPDKEEFVFAGWCSPSIPRFKQLEFLI